MEPDHSPKELVLSGTVVAGGMAKGNARLFFNTNIHAPLAAVRGVRGKKAGWLQIEAAMQRQLESLDCRIRQGGFCEDSAATAMLETYRVFLLDPVLHASLQEELRRNGDKAPEAIQTTCRKLIGNFEQIASGQIQPKALLIADLGKMLLDALDESPETVLSPLSENHVLVADHLFVSDVVALHRIRPAAIVVQHGHPASHGLILARELEIPILCQVRDITRLVRPDVPLVVDADQSCVILHPACTLLPSVPLPGHSPAATGSPPFQSLEIDGIPVRVMADTGSPAASVRTRDAGADGIGLLRMESLYMQAESAPDRDEILRRLPEILEPMAGRPAYVRLLDAGGDKPLSYLKDSLGGSTMTGYRGIRLLAAHPELLKSQLQALLKLSRRYDLHILVPMVTVAEEMRTVRTTLEAEARREGIPPPPLGAMVETPSAALLIDRIWKWSDFVRIGSNDLTQYTLAASRASPLAEGYFQPTHPSVLKLVGMVCRSEEAGLIGLCGSLAGREDMVPQLLGLGLREFTVPPRSVRAIKRAVSEYCAE